MSNNNCDCRYCAHQQKIDNCKYCIYEKQEKEEKNRIITWSINNIDNSEEIS